MKNNELVTKWVLEAVKKSYADDIALVVSHTTLRIDNTEKTVSYFVPITEKGYTFGRTFILDGEGFDIWGIDWERLENFAELLEYNITCLADSELLYARTPDDAGRFEALKEKQATNLADPVLMRKNALEAYAQAKTIYMQMLFSKGSDVKLGAGYVLDYLGQSIAFSNLRYFKQSQISQLEELKTMSKVPEEFHERYLQIIAECSEEVQKKLCYELICLVQSFLDDQTATTEPTAKEFNFQDLADWYAELSYTWLRIRHYCKKNDFVKVYMWGIMLQGELNRICDDFALTKFELVSAFDKDNLNEFATVSNKIEDKIRTIITNGGGVIHEYKNFEEFSNEI